MQSKNTLLLLVILFVVVVVVLWGAITRSLREIKHVDQFR